VAAAFSESGACRFHLIRYLVKKLIPPAHLTFLFRFHQWKANNRIRDIQEIKSIPYTPISHPFVERLIGTIRREYLDHLLFFNRCDLLNKLNQFRDYYNNHRAHAALQGQTPEQKAQGKKADTVPLKNYTWQSHCRGLFFTPVPV